jgi:hypothetical protein
MSWNAVKENTIGLVELRLITVIFGRIRQKMM